MNVIITGASRGIGRAIAEAFGREGYHLLLNGRQESTLSQVMLELATAYPGIRVNYKAADLSVKSEVDLFADWCLSQGVPSILVNNAGEYLPGNCLDEPEGNLEIMMRSNLFSAYHLSRRIAPAMIKEGGGHIFNICSIAALGAYEGGGSYSISKFAMHGLGMNLRHELKKHKVKVTSVFPGAVMTDSWKGFDNSRSRIMEASDIAEMVVASSKLSHQAVVEEIIMRPQLGDLN